MIDKPPCPKHGVMHMAREHGWNFSHRWVCRFMVSFGIECGYRAVLKA